MIGEFDLDLCSTPINPIDKHTFTKDVDGTQQEWSPYGGIWLNPHYSNPTTFIQKKCANTTMALHYSLIDKTPRCGKTSLQKPVQLYSSLKV